MIEAPGLAAAGAWAGQRAPSHESISNRSGPGKDALRRATQADSIDSMVPRPDAAKRTRFRAGSIQIQQVRRVADEHRAVLEIVHLTPIEYRHTEASISALALAWLWAVDQIRPALWDPAGAVVALAGMTIIMFQPAG